MRSRLKAAVPQVARRWIKINRARLFETIGSARYSTPALSRLDRVMLQYLPDEPGVFLEIGANDGYAQSNTYYLEKFKSWRGILIEPLPSLYRTCQRVRPNSTCVNVACVGPEGPASVDMVDLGLMSVALGLQERGEEASRLSGRPKGQVNILTRTLSSIIEEVGEPTIDFMSIDVEGAELEVLSGLDLDRHAPNYLLVETAHPEKITLLVSPHLRLERKLTHHDYLFARL